MKTLIVGCGNMGGAMLAGWLAGGADPTDFTVVDPVLAEVPSGVKLLRQLPQNHFDAILLGIKPQGLGELAPKLAPVTPGALILSILAGVDLDVLASRFPEAAGYVRIVPNLAAAIGKSPIALVERGLVAAQRDELLALMLPLGTPEWLADESMFDLVTALAGSGPAFVYRFIDALSEGASELGLPDGQAQRLAVAMVEGAAALAAASPHAPAELARRVASPGGVTQVGLDILDRQQALARLVEDTLRGAAERSAEMAAAAQG